MNDAPRSVFFMVDLSLPSLRCDVLSGGFHRRMEGPGELRASRVTIPVNVDLDGEKRPTSTESPEASCQGATKVAEGCTKGGREG